MAGDIRQRPPAEATAGSQLPQHVFVHEYDFGLSRARQGDAEPIGVVQVIRYPA